MDNNEYMCPQPYGSHTGTHLVLPRQAAGGLQGNRKAPTNGCKGALGHPDSDPSQPLFLPRALPNSTPFSFTLFISKVVGSGHELTFYRKAAREGAAQNTFVTSTAAAPEPCRRQGAQCGHSGARLQRSARSSAPSAVRSAPCRHAPTPAAAQRYLSGIPRGCTLHGREIRPRKAGFGSARVLLELVRYRSLLNALKRRASGSYESTGPGAAPPPQRDGAAPFRARRAGAARGQPPFHAAPQPLRRRHGDAPRRRTPPPPSRRFPPAPPPPRPAAVPHRASLRLGVGGWEAKRCRSGAPPPYLGPLLGTRHARSAARRQAGPT